MRISDWSSDVGSSDLSGKRPPGNSRPRWPAPGHHRAVVLRQWQVRHTRPGWPEDQDDRGSLPLKTMKTVAIRSGWTHPRPLLTLPTRDRTSLVEGKSVSVRVELGVRRSIKNKK